MELHSLLLKNSVWVLLKPFPVQKIPGIFLVHYYFYS